MILVSELLLCYWQPIVEHLVRDSEHRRSFVPVLNEKPAFVPSVGDQILRLKILGLKFHFEFSSNIFTFQRAWT